MHFLGCTSGCTAWSLGTLSRLIHSFRFSRPNWGAKMAPKILQKNSIPKLLRISSITIMLWIYMYIFHLSSSVSWHAKFGRKNEKTHDLLWITGSCVAYISFFIMRPRNMPNLCFICYIRLKTSYSCYIMRFQFLECT